MKKLYYVLLGIVCSTLYCVHIYALQVAPLTSNSIASASLNYAASANAGLFAITSAGYYYLTEDLLLSQSPSNTNPIILISASNVVLDLATKTITGNGNANVIFAGIQVADGVSNVTIKNGIISAISSTTSAANGFGIVINNGAASTVSHVILQDLSIFNCGYFGISIRSCNDVIINNVICTNNGPNINAGTSGAQSGFTGGVYLETIKTSTIKNSSFSNNAWQVVSPTASNHVVGALLKTCLNIAIVDSHFDNNTNTTTDVANGGVHAVGLWSFDTANCLYTNVTANSNTRSGSTTTSGNSTNVFGFRLQSTTSPNSTGNIFTNCQAINNTGTIFSAGFAATANSGSNIFENCVANLNSSFNNLTATTAASAYGFYFLSLVANTCRNCRAEANFVIGGNNAGVARTVGGFYSAGCYSNQFIKCQANYNNISTASNDPARPTTSASYQTAFSFATGFQLGDIGIYENNTILRYSTANKNTTLSASTNAPCFGILILPWTSGVPTTTTVSKGSVIEWCETSFNTSANASAAWSYGIVDLTPGKQANQGAAAIGSTTFMRYNISAMQGTTGKINAFISNNMNYYLDYSSNINANYDKVIFETVFVDFTTNINNPGGYNIYNLSLTPS